jgi:hypothetical protein
MLRRARALQPSVAMLDVPVIGGLVIAVWPRAWYIGCVLILLGLAAGPRVTHCFCFHGGVDVANPYLDAQGVLSAALAYAALRWKQVRPTPPPWLRRLASYCALIVVLCVGAVLDGPGAYDALDFVQMSLVAACVLLACMAIAVLLHRPPLPTAVVIAAAPRPGRTAP